MRSDARRGEVVLFGGAEDFGQTPARTDTWILTGAGWQEREASSPTVSAQSRTAMVFSASDQHLYLTAGTASTAAAGVWTWDGATWASEETASPFGQGIPPRLYAESAAWDEQQGRWFFAPAPRCGRYVRPTTLARRT